MKRGATNNKGFSLVELIIVIAIMAILIGVIAPQFTRKKAASPGAEQEFSAGRFIKVLALSAGCPGRHRTA